MVSALRMSHRFRKALRHAMRSEDFGPILGAALLLIAVGTLAYTLGQDWSLLDGFYFAVATLTTSSIADPDLVLTEAWLKIFTVFYILIGIGILVEVARRLGISFIAVSKQEHEARMERLHRRSAETEDR
jgi:uncharacterized membrane protein YkgB